MKKRTFLSSVALLATAMTATAGVTPANFTQNHDAISATPLAQDTQAKFVLENKASNSSAINVAQHSSHSSHSSHASHASSRY
jgi:hypothetical protein